MPKSIPVCLALCIFGCNGEEQPPFHYCTANPPDEACYSEKRDPGSEQIAVARAIAELNGEAADQVADADPCVQDMPVKRLVFVRVIGYEVAAQEQGKQARIIQPSPLQLLPELKGESFLLRGELFPLKYQFQIFIATL